MTAARKFEDFDAATIHRPQPLLVGITSPSAGGKTFSALEMATGMVAVTGGQIFLLDTESDRALHYKNLFKFRHVPFAPPHSPEAYEQAIDYCVGRGAKVIIVDSMTHEHSGEGGVLDQSEEYLNKKAGDDWKARDKYKWTSWIMPMGQRRRLNRKIVMLGGKVIFIFCYRAEDKTKPVKGGDPIYLGWTAETTSRLPFEMTVRFLLPPGSDGRPSLNPDTEFEKLSIKMPIQFRDWFKPGLQLTRALGERLARWSAGEQSSTPAPVASSSGVGGPPPAGAAKEHGGDVGGRGGVMAAPSPGEPAKGPNGRIAETGPAAPEQVEEMKTEIKRLGWNAGQVKAWCRQFGGATWVDKIAARFAVQAIQGLTVVADPESEPGSNG